MDFFELESIMRDNDIHDKRIALKESREQAKDELYKSQIDDYYAKRYAMDRSTDIFYKFKKDVSEAFVTEALVCLVNSCIDSITLSEDYNKKLSRQLVSNFVHEEGAGKLLNKMKGTSYMMSEIAYICNESINAVMEKADPNDKDSLKIDNKTKDEFYKKLDKVDADHAIETIRERVKTSTEDFIDSNTKDKMKIKDTLEKTKKKVEKAKEDKKSEEVQECYVNTGKRQITDIRSSKIKNVYEAMVYALSEAALKNESAKKIFVENAGLNMDRITEHCEILYTFLTTLDSCKLINVDEQYIETMLKDMKK